MCAHWLSNTQLFIPITVIGITFHNPVPPAIMVALSQQKGHGKRKSQLNNTWSYLYENCVSFGVHIMFISLFISFIWTYLYRI